MSFLKERSKSNFFRDIQTKIYILNCLRNLQYYLKKFIFLKNNISFSLEILNHVDKVTPLDHKKNIKEFKK